MLSLSNLSPQKGSTKQRKRLGRGPGSGHGKTAGRGHKGFKARSGSGIKLGFEGGQMPLQRRLPKRGFTNIFRREYAIVNVKELDKLEAGIKVDRNVLLAAGLIRSKDNFVKILGEGEVTKKFILAVDKVSESARSKIEKAGGSIEE